MRTRRERRRKGKRERRRRQVSSQPVCLLTQGCGSQSSPGPAQGNVKDLLLLAADQVSW